MEGGLLRAAVGVEREVGYAGDGCRKKGGRRRW